MDPPIPETPIIETELGTPKFVQSVMDLNRLICCTLATDPDLDNILGTHCIDGPNPDEL
jgi:hypothetical protein